jgi:Zn-dependent protease with chaperone function
MQVNAVYYDGCSARRHDVVLSLQQGRLNVAGSEWAREEPLAALDIPAPLGNTPRLILFADGARCEIQDRAGFAALLQAAGHAVPAFAARLEARWSYAAAVLLLTLALVAASYVWGLPYLASATASRIPQGVLSSMDAQFLMTFDGRLLQPSKLSAARQQALASRLSALRWPPGTVRPTQLLFRSSEALGPNAMALPGGTVLLLDDLINLAQDDEEILGVLAHETGHVSERHALRQMLQASVVGLVMVWYVGDISNVLATAPAALLQTRYSRDFERRADDYASRVLALNGINPAHFADMLQRLEQAHGSARAARGAEWTDYLSTHPATDERIRALRGQR